MIILIKENTASADLREFISSLRKRGVTVDTAAAPAALILTGGSLPDADRLSALEFVREILPLREPYSLASRHLHPQNTVVTVGSARIGDGGLTLIAGPCSVEPEEQTVAVAKAVKAGGAALLRGGAFKPRTSPYTFQGLGERGLAFLKTAGEEAGLPIVSEIMDAAQLPLFRDVDVLQIGARNMQNYELLKAVGRQEKPVLLKRGLSATYEEWLMSAEYILKGGNPRVILCERGIRTFESHTRSTLDISAVPVLRELTHLPVLVDPSHASGRASLVAPLSAAAVAAGCDGLEIEVHDHPACALCDGAQALTPDTFSRLAKELFALHGFLQTEACAQTVERSRCRRTPEK